MEELKLTCEVITPMFMAGADEKTPELRPSEFKGMMRFWWRAIKAEDDIERLKKEEAKLFGGTREGEGKSKVKIRIFPRKLEIGKAKPLPHHETKQFELSSILPTSTFEVVLSCRNNSEIDFYKDLFLASIVLGGFGKRSRRGFGSIRAVSINDELFRQNIDLNFIAGLLNRIRNNTYRVEEGKIINNKRGGNYPWIKKIEVGKRVDNFNDLLKKIGQASHNNSNPSLGFTAPRMASPIYVSVIRQIGGYIPVVTTLNSRFPSNYPRWDFNKQNSFIKEVTSV